MNFETAQRITIERNGELPPVIFKQASYAVGHSTANVRTGDGEIIFPLQTITNITILW